MEAETFYTLYLFLLGLCAGSFANACIYRWVQETSLFPRSRCTVCNHEIAWYDNIPVLSYIFLGGKCRHCHAAISLRYPAIELLMGFFFVATYHIYGITWAASKILFLAWMFTVALATDLSDYEIPDELCVMGLVMGGIMVLVGATSWQDMLIGALIPSIPLLILTLIVMEATGQENVLGGGDLKFLMGVGALGGSFLSSMTLLFGCMLLGFFLLGKVIEDYFTGTRTYVPLAVGFFLAFLFMFLLGALPVIII